MTGSPPTQKQIAERLGVSQTLVSRALSGRAAEIGASERTVARIRKAAAEWNYQPSAAALALLGAPTRTVGVVVRDFEDPYFGRLIGGLQVEAGRMGLSLLLTGDAAADLHGLHKHKVDAIVLAGSDFFPSGLGVFLREGVKVVRIGGGVAQRGVARVRMDEESAVGVLADHLAGLGHVEIGFVGRCKPLSIRRAEALRNALARLSLPVRAGSILLVDGGVEDVARRVAGRLRGGGPAATAWIAAEDMLALVLLGVFRREGLRVPEDVSVAGIDDIPMAALATPALTTLRQPIDDMARVAMELIEAAGKADEGRVLRGSLVVRESCGKPGGRLNMSKDKVTKEPNQGATT